MIMTTILEKRIIKFILIVFFLARIAFKKETQFAKHNFHVYFDSFLCGFKMETGLCYTAICFLNTHTHTHQSSYLLATVYRYVIMVQGMCQLASSPFSTVCQFAIVWSHTEVNSELKCLDLTTWRLFHF